MVSMVSMRPTVTVNHGRVTVDERLIRTPVILTPVRLTRRGRMVVTAVTALLIGMVSVALATTAQARRAGSPPPGRYIAKGDGPAGAEPLVPR